MEVIPGVDRKYINYAKESKALVLRAFPKGVLPEFETDVSQLSGSILFRQWVSDFRDYWDSEDIEWILMHQIADLL